MLGFLNRFGTTPLLSLTLFFLKHFYNPDFNCTEFGAIKNAAGSNNFVLSVKTWIERTNAIGIVSKAGRYGGN